jgi:hypothetical protein
MAPAAEGSKALKTEDTALHAAIRDAHAAGRLVLEVNYAAVNNSASPSFRTTDIVVPWFVTIVVSFYVWHTYGVIAGAAVFVVLAGGVVVGLRPWNRRRAEERTRDMALAKLDHWDTFWRLGGLALRRTGGGDDCVAPRDDWRDFARALAPARQEAS